MPSGSLPISQQAFQDFTKMLRENVGLALDDTKEYLLDSRLSAIARDAGYANYGGLIQHLNSTSIGPLHWKAFEALLTNETMFFRDEHFFSGLKDSAFPDLFKKNKEQKKIKIWCTSVSTGQEAYSLAILLKEYFPGMADWDIQIHASDICKEAIKKAKAGTYNHTEIHRGLSPDLIEKYFTVDAKGEYVANSSLKSMIHFFNVNLIEPLHEIQVFDLILIRNVLIYFLPETKKEVLRKIRTKLRDDDSLLMLGAAESLISDITFQPHRVGKFSFFTKISK